MRIQMLREIDARPTAGIPIALLLVATFIGGLWIAVMGGRSQSAMIAVSGVLLSTLVLMCTPGLFSVAPNEGKVLTLFGNYKGTAKTPGLWFTNPFMTKKAVSLRVRNFETNKL